MALMESGISDWSTIEGGLSELRQSPGPFLPSTGDFIAMCKARQLKKLDLPSEREAYQQLQRFMAPRDPNRDFSKLHPAVYAAYKKLDWSVVSQQSDDKQRRRFSEAWGEVQRDIDAGRELPQYTPPERQIERPVATLDINPADYLDSLKSLFDSEDGRNGEGETLR